MYHRQIILHSIFFLVLPSNSSWKISKNWSSLKNNTKIKHKIVLAKHIGLIQDQLVYFSSGLRTFSSSVFIFIHNLKFTSLLFWNTCLFWRQTLAICQGEVIANWSESCLSRIFGNCFSLCKSGKRLREMFSFKQRCYRLKLDSCKKYPSIPHLKLLVA